MPPQSQKKRNYRILLYIMRVMTKNTYLKASSKQFRKNATSRQIIFLNLTSNNEKMAAVKKNDQSNHKLSLHILHALRHLLYFFNETNSLTHQWVNQNCPTKESF
jgi:hypothetical protein